MDIGVREFGLVNQKRPFFYGVSTVGTDVGVAVLVAVGAGVGVGTAPSQEKMASALL